MIMAIYFTQKERDAPPRNDVVASVARILLSEFQRKK